VRVALGRIEEQIAYAGARDVLLLGRDIGEDDAAGNPLATPVPCGTAEVGLAEFGEAEQPEVGFGSGGEDTQPSAEGGWVDLTTVNEAVERARRERSWKLTL
jgi:hypothetical protein